MTDLRASIALLLLRVTSGGLLIALHGWGKLMSFSSRAETFSDPLGVGSKVSLALAVFGEVICPAAVVLGFQTRLAAIPPAITMIVAAVLVHAADPWGKKELALVYGAAFVALALLGGGKYSIDGLRRRTVTPGGFR
jgi:putative oxidoreductase